MRWLGHGGGFVSGMDLEGCMYSMVKEERCYIYCWFRPGMEGPNGSGPCRAPLSNCRGSPDRLLYFRQYTVAV